MYLDYFFSYVLGKFFANFKPATFLKPIIVRLQTIHNSPNAPIKELLTNLAQQSFRENML